MNKAVIWLVVLVVVVGVAFLVFGRGDGGANGDEGESGRPTGVPAGFGQTTYEALSQELGNLQDEFARSQVVQAKRRWSVSGVGTVVAVGETRDGITLDIDMDGDTANAEVFADVPEDRLLTDRPSEGTKVQFSGQMTGATYEDGAAVVDLIRTVIKAAP